MKVRFSSFDVFAIVKNIQESCLSLRVNNVYDLNNKTYMIKLNAADGKCFIMFESGVRLHVTEFDWEKSDVPSGFSMKLRKHLKGRRLEYAKQLNVFERVIDLCFGSGEAAYHLIIELYDKGNVLLTDHEFTILHLVRPRKDADLKSKEKYVFPEPSTIVSHLTSSPAPNDEVLSDLVPRLIKESIEGAKSNSQLKRCLLSKFPVGLELIEHFLLVNEQDPNFKVKSDTILDQTLMDKLIASMTSVLNVFLGTEHLDLSKGYVLYTQRETVKSVDRPDEKETIEVFEDFLPALFRQFEARPHRIFKTFSAAVDEYFSRAEETKMKVQASAKTTDALKRLDNVKKQLASQIESLTDRQTADSRAAELLSLNQNLVDRVILTVTGALANRASWVQVNEIVAAGKLAGDPAAEAIVALKLDENAATLRLTDPYDESGDSAVVRIDLTKSAFQNVSSFHTDRKIAAVKEVKTVEASTKALKSAQVKTNKMLKQVRTNLEMSKARKAMWFEKFLWFLSSDRVLVVGGRDAQQNEQIVKRYLQGPDDLYLHSELHGASAVVVKAPANDAETEPNHDVILENDTKIPVSTVTEAAQAAVCYSSAFHSHVVNSAFWVKSDQVSKTAPTGEYLTTGGFMIRGKRNYLTPPQLVMGLGVLWSMPAANDPKDDDEDGDDDDDDDNVDEVGDNTTFQRESGEMAREDIPSAEETPDLNNGDTIDASVEINENEPLGDDVDVVDFPDTVIDPLGPTTSNKQNFGHQTSNEHVRPTVVEKRRLTKHQLKKANKKAATLASLSQLDQDELVIKQKLLGVDKNLPIEKKVEVTDEKPKKEPKMKNERVESKDEKRYVPVAPEILARTQKIVKKEMTKLQRLTPDPPAGVLPEFALPVCAPYTALTGYKFRAKLIPGQTKRGKAAKTILEHFVKIASPEERKLLKQVKVEEWCRNMPGKVKVMFPSLPNKSTKS